MTTLEIMQRAKAAAPRLGTLGTEEKNAALLAMADAIEARCPEILRANEADCEAARAHISEVMLDRLRLTADRVTSMAQGIRQAAALPDPVGRVISRIERPNGLIVEKTGVALGVIAIIYESRPNVTSDAGALALKAGSACILRSGREAYGSAAAIVSAMQQGLETCGLPRELVQLVSDTTRQSSVDLMNGVGYIDLLIPRGGAGLIRACMEQAKVPCIQTGTGICHIYVDSSADLDRALDIVENAKASRPSVCNAEEVLLVNSAVAEEFLPCI